ncbi:MAG: hypothetical protein IKZ87_07710 [Actinomycetaceae bacterium]|nr:hypothetical protein [Actinomycetaceae bacterium]
MKKTKLFASFLAASLAALSLGVANPAIAVPNQLGNETTYRVKINTLDAENKQLADATFNIESANGKVVDTFTSTNEAYYAELSEGTYTLVETKAPTGFTTATSQTFTVKSQQHGLTQQSVTSTRQEPQALYM